MNEQQAIALRFPCIEAKQCADPIYSRWVDRHTTVTLTVNVGEE